MRIVLAGEAIPEAAAAASGYVAPARGIKANTPKKLLQLTWLCFGFSSAAAGASPPQETLFDVARAFSHNTHLIELSQGSRLSNIVASAGTGGFETAHGSWISFNRWYRSNWTDARITWVTQMSPNVGLVWGASTGERAEKYTISPSLKLGLVFQAPVQKNAFISIKGTTILGGRLKEKSCVADYGEIGGVQEVNCRLAASPLEPSQTLTYNLNEKPYRHALMVQYSRLF